MGEELAWARIVAGYDQPVRPEVSWPSDEDDDGASPRDVDLATPRPDVFDPDWSAPMPAEPTADADRYVPPEPEPLPPLDGVRTAAWTAVIGAPIMLVLAVLLRISLPPLAAWGLVAAFVAGFITLVVSMRTSDDDPYGGDDGAVV